MTDITTITPAAPASGAPAAAPSPNPVADAITRRNALIADQKFGEKYRAGDLAARQEMAVLNSTITNSSTADRVDNVIRGTATGGTIEITSPEHPLTTSNIRSAAEQFVPALGTEAFKDVMLGNSVSAEKKAEATNLKKQLMTDREWLRAYREGSEAHRQQMTRINAILVAPLAEAAK
jgi:tRNA U34 5-methylaminomethyl-2-thiouridine-forming methyltransferase MnmC